MFRKTTIFVFVFSFFTVAHSSAFAASYLGKRITCWDKLEQHMDRVQKNKRQKCQTVGRPHKRMNANQTSSLVYNYECRSRNNVSYLQIDLDMKNCAIEESSQNNTSTTFQAPQKEIDANIVM